ncbi:MAG: tryptophan synthase subunit alpha [Candidatus Dormibacteria bacterium]
MRAAGFAQTRIRTALARRPGQPHLVPYLMAGFPHRDDTVSLLLAAQAAGAALVELGLPYSDPLADGPTIQAAGQRALAEGMTVAIALRQVRQARAEGLSVPLVVMTYLNPILRMGLAEFCRAAVASGVDGVLVPDLPLEEAEELVAAAKSADLGIITMVAPTTPDQRLARAAALSTGFLYCVSRTGVTGGGPEDQEEGRQLLLRARRLTDIPVALGFGVRRPEQIQSLAGLADAVVVGSVLLEAATDAVDPARAVGLALERLRATN